MTPKYIRSGMANARFPPVERTVGNDPYRHSVVLPRVIKECDAAIQAGRMFWFEAIPRNNNLVNRGITLVGAGYLKLPYEDCVFAYSDAIMQLGVAVHFIREENDNIVASIFLCSKERVMYSGTCGIMAGSSPVTCAPILDCISHDGRSMLKDHAMLGAIAGVFSIGLLTLNTLNVPVETIVADAKLQAARKKSGKPPLAAYHRVDPYYTRIVARDAAGTGNSQGGTHASPVPHIRRGHVRALPGGATTWVRDCLVNGKKGPPGSRMFYDVPGMAG